MKLNKTYEHIIKKSKFIGYYYKIDELNEVKTILEALKKEHKKANHVVYAYKCFNTAGKTDDKEPTNSAGLPIYKILEYKNIEGLIVIVRYFGGTKLGIGPLTRTYSLVANELTK